MEQERTDTSTKVLPSTSSQSSSNLGKAKTLNLGLSTQFLNGKFGLDFDWFHSNRNDILCYRNASIPYYAGMTLPQENIGEVTNSGIEIIATYRDRAGDFEWGITGNLTYAK